MSLPDSEVRERIVEARRDIADAEVHLDTVIRAAGRVPRQSKTMLSRAAEAAFAKLRLAHGRLEKLEEHLANKAAG